METAEIRRRWLAFFESRGHTVVPSAPLLYDDPNLLFVNAGMVPFKPYFLGQETAPYKRATSVQKCVRTGDIEEVGKTTRHGTFFQMNGNFSFGDYFKKKAIKYAWEFVTGRQEDGFLGFDPDKVWVTVLGPGFHPDYPEGDKEAYDHWISVGVPAERIQGRSLKDNYWHMGVEGPGGPCSEIYIDRGPEFGADGGPEADEDRFLEIWNLVFQTEEITDVKAKDDFRVVGPLPAKNIDTGMGLERVAFLLQGVDNLYEIDEVYPVIERAEAISGRTYGADAGDDVRFRVVADHVRSSLMLIGDGVTPGNEGRGYVLRRLLRRAVRSMRLLGVTTPALPELLPVSMEQMSKSYPELKRDFSRISQIAYAEEEAFRRTLTSGTTILDSAVSQAKSSGARVLGGDKAFQLHDTYGFPIDLTLEMAAEQGLSVDEEGFRRLMGEQRARAKADAKAKKQGHGDAHAYREVADSIGHAVEFTGYDEVRSEARVSGLIIDGEVAPAAAAGQDVELVLDRTPFYAEGGGQLADGGRIELDNGAVIEVRDVQSPIRGLIVHKATVVSGEVAPGLAAHALVDLQRRRAISRAHTATHMVHKAIREALGDTATQAGSENAPGRFRFDFNATSAVPVSVLGEVESKVNTMLLEDLEVRADVMTQEEAVASGAMALFGEKYGNEVRVISVGEWARELCGGTHAQRSGQLGVVKLLGEASIGSGVRRVEALVGSDAYDFLAREAAIVGQLTGDLKVRSEELPERVSSILGKLKDAEREIQQLRQQQALAKAGQLASQAKDVYGVSFIGHHADGLGADDLRALVLDLRGRLGADRPGVVAAATEAKGRPVVIVATNERAREWGIKAGDLVRVAAQTLGGGGGGKDDLAQGGGQDAGKIDEALTQVEWTVGARATQR
ncbi:alanine--tRNA ligase [Arsenicicoccus sp. oral taxon 190]|uniref:alanine--tRNA ligase n=1 Tax=Arsenicicoccus sp. oral taxon 190 TaxID=1658671 RepID=UPI000679EF54|nr:alanine--tRNA ligase [Arsenicicoccus sp. oral taxon 190]AKT51701.1 alanyl-tRNA synthetase [Arsenicicoccus sp. oral taxon 190]